jgi:hypothetical protein
MWYFIIEVIIFFKKIIKLPLTPIPTHQVYLLLKDLKVPRVKPIQTGKFRYNLVIAINFNPTLKNLKKFLSPSKVYII